ncbi:hypothetical protein Tco_0573612 [Tanacetum coccineum]
MEKLRAEMKDVIVTRNCVAVVRTHEESHRQNIQYRRVTKIEFPKFGGEDVREAMLRIFGNSFDGPNMKYSSNGVNDSSLNSRRVDKLKELLVKDSHFIKNTCAYNMFDELPIEKSLKQEGVKEASDTIDKNIGKMVLDKAFKECDKLKEFEFIDSSEVDNGIQNIKGKSEVIDNKHVVIMDEPKRLVNTTSQLNLSEMFDGFDYKLDEVIVGDYVDTQLRTVKGHRGDIELELSTHQRLEECLGGIEYRLRCQLQGYEDDVRVFVGPLAWVSPNEQFLEGGLISGEMYTLVLVWNLALEESVDVGGS